MVQVNRVGRREFLRWLSLAAMSALAGCAPKATEPTKSAATAAKPTAVPVATTAPTSVELRWGDWPDMTGTKEAIEKFQQSNPGLKVTYEPFGDNFDQKLMAQCVAGTAPDIMSIFGSMFFAFADKKQLLDLKPFVDKYMTKEEVGDFFKWHWPDGFTVPETGMLAGLPWKVNIGCIIYNKDAFDEIKLAYPTENWDHDNYADAIRRLTKKGEGGKYQRYGGLLLPWAWDRFQTHVLAFGGHVVDPKDRTKCLLGEKPAQDALEWMRKLLWDEKTLVPDSEIKSLRGWGASFVEGKVGVFESMLNAVVDHVLAATKTAPNPVKFGVMHIPKGPVGRFALGSTDGWAIYKGTKNPDWAWKLAYSLTQDLYQKMNVIEWQNQLAPRRSQFKYFEESVVKPWLAKGVDMSIFTKALEMGYCRPAESFIKQQEAQVVMQEALDKVYRVGGTPVSEFANVCKKIETIHKA